MSDELHNYTKTGIVQLSDDIVTRLRDRYPNVVHPHILRDAQLVGEAAAEIERLRTDRDRWKNVAEQLFLWLHPSPEDDSVYEAGVEAMTMYEQAVRGE